MPDISNEDRVKYLAVEGMGFDPPPDSYYRGRTWRYCEEKASWVPWNPLTDANDLFGKGMLVDKMKEAGYSVDLFMGSCARKPNRCYVWLRRKYPEITLLGQHDADTPGDAVCQAAYRALLAMKENPDE